MMVVNAVCRFSAGRRYERPQIFEPWSLKITNNHVRIHSMNFPGTGNRL